MTKRNTNGSEFRKWKSRHVGSDLTALCDAYAEHAEIEADLILFDNEIVFNMVQSQKKSKIVKLW